MKRDTSRTWAWQREREREAKLVSEVFREAEVGSKCNWGKGKMCGSVAITIILPLMEILKFDWLRQILYAAILCFLTNLIFLKCLFHVTC